MFTIKNNTNQKIGSTLVVDALRQAGVTKMFGYPGACILSLYNELANQKDINHCLCRHEQACVHAAEGYARISGEIGVVLVTSGPGATNTVTGIANASADCTPLLIIAGAPNETEGKVFQNVDFENMVSGIVKKFYAPTINDNLYEVINEAIILANSGKKGPVVVQVTRTILEQTYSCSSNDFKHINNNNDNFDAKEISGLIKSAKSPLFLIGGGCNNVFEEITNIATKNKIHAVTTLMGVGNINSSCPYYKGMIGVNGVDEANNLLYTSDLIIALGVAFSDRTTCRSELFANGTPIININLEPCSQDNVNIILEVNRDCNEVVKTLLNENIEKEALNQTKNVNITSKNSEKMSAGEVLATINKFTEKLSPIIITDVGQHQMFAAQNFQFSKPRRFLTSGGLGTMGFGLPASCGAHFAEPNTCIINITGDGSFQMNIQELATVREYQIPVKIFVMNNGYLGMIRQTQEKLYNGKYYQSKMNNPDFITLAKGYDIKGFRVSSISQLQEYLPEIFNNDQPIIVDCITDEFENV